MLFRSAVVAVFLNVGLFILFTTASPCILYVVRRERAASLLNASLTRVFRNPQTGVECPYGAPSVSAWVAVAEAVSLPSLRVFSPLYNPGARSLTHPKN